LYPLSEVQNLNTQIVTEALTYVNRTSYKQLSSHQSLWHGPCNRKGNWKQGAQKIKRRREKMKNLTNTFAAIVMMFVIVFGTTFANAGIIIAKSETPEPTCNTTGSR
jgi:hypothetical protein